MKIYDKMNKTRFHMTMFFSRIIAEICKLPQNDEQCKSWFDASNMKRKKYLP